MTRADALPYQGPGKTFEINTIFFILLAVLLRIVFWIYTDRVWEDAVITLSPAKNLWEGYGLTHHITEPRVYSFTSGISILTLIVGEAFGHAIAFNRLLSLVAAGFAIFSAARILRRFQVGVFSQAVCMSFLATDHLQIFFGMAGMETEIATAAALGLVWTATEERWRLMGVFAGIAALARPELPLLALACLAYAAVRLRLKVWVPVLIAASIYLPWFVFTWAYYGSPIPNTITAKRADAGLPNLATVWLYTQYFFWKQFAPFVEFVQVTRYPGPSLFPTVAAMTVLVLGLLGFIYSMVRAWVPLILAGLVVCCFCAYEIRFTVNTYYMWYTPPFFALFFLLVSVGVHLLSRYAKWPAYAFGAFVMAAYAVHLPFTLVLDRSVQNDVEVAVREKVGARLEAVMGPGDSVFLEPLGYIGLHVRNRQIYDYPGLGSKISGAAYRKYGLRAMQVLKPTYIVMRPSELETAKKNFPDIFNDYKMVDHFVGKTGREVAFAGLAYWVVDNEFYLFKKTAG